MNELTKQKVYNNWLILKKSYSSAVIGAATLAGGWWLGMDSAEQAAWLTTHQTFAPLIPYAAYITAAIWFVTRLWPQFFPRPAEVKDPRMAQYDDFLAKLQAAGIGAAPAPAVTVTVAQPAPPAAPIAEKATAREWSPEERLLWAMLTKARAARGAAPIDHPLP